MSKNQKKLKFAIVGTGNRGVLYFGKMLVKREDCEIASSTEDESADLPARLPARRRRLYFSQKMRQYLLFFLCINVYCLCRHCSPQRYASTYSKRRIL